MNPPQECSGFTQCYLFLNLFFPCTQQYSALNRYQLHIIVFIQDVFDAHDFFPMICTCNISHSLCLIYSTSPQPDRDGDVSTSTLTWGTNVAHATFSQVDEARSERCCYHEDDFRDVGYHQRGDCKLVRFKQKGRCIYIHESMRMEGWKDADEKKVDVICQLLEGILDLWGFGRVAFAQLHTLHPKFACFYTSNAKSIHLIHSIYKSPNIEAPLWCFCWWILCITIFPPAFVSFFQTHTQTSDPQTFVGLRYVFAGEQWKKGPWLVGWYRGWKSYPGI